jgi:hypothetical protein
MKWKLWVGLYVVGLLGAGCQGCDLEPPPPPPPPPKVVVDERHVLTVEGTTVRYNGQVLPWEAGPERWQQVLGPRSRLDEFISVWDELGVFLYHNAGPDNSRPSSFAVLLGRTRHSPLTDSEPDFWPRRTFPGRLVVDGAVISRGMTISHVMYINRDKKGSPFRLSYLDTIYSYDLDGFLIGLEFGHDSSLTSFSISPHSPSVESEEDQEPGSRTGATE